MTHVLELAWQDVEHLIHGRKLDYTALRTVMSVRIMASVRDGHTDPEYLKHVAIDGRKEVSCAIYVGERPRPRIFSSLAE